MRLIKLFYQSGIMLFFGLIVIHYFAYKENVIFVLPLSGIIFSIFVLSLYSGNQKLMSMVLKIWYPWGAPDPKSSLLVFVYSAMFFLAFLIESVFCFIFRY